MQLRSQAGNARAIGAAIWLAVAVAGLAGLGWQSLRPGQAGVPPSRWPAAHAALRDPARPTLLVAFHPACACSSATVEGIDRLSARVGDRIALRALLASPGDEPARWADSRVASALARLPSVRVTHDVRAEIARDFGALTSGHALLYDASGALRASGGLTPARGHVGDTDVTRAALALALAGETLAAAAPVYGCSLTGSLAVAGQRP